MSNWSLKEIETKIRWQITKGNTAIYFTRYEYDAHPEFLWICLCSNDYCYGAEIKGDEATEIYALLSINGVPGDLYKDKRYKFKGFEDD